MLESVKSLGAWCKPVGCDAAFNNHFFILAFLPLVVLIYWLFSSRRNQLAWLTLSGLLFYSFWDTRYVALVLVSAMVDFHIASRIPGARRPKLWLVASVIFNLSVLFFFKYAMFARDTAQSLFTLLGLDGELPYYDIVLPVGISFYTFQTMSYTIDVYRGDIKPTRDFLKYLTFVSLFPQLVAGPIVRFSEIGEQLTKSPSSLTSREWFAATSLFGLGLFKKTAVADTLAPRIANLWSNPEALSLVDAWTAAGGFALQFYADFSGYSDMAIAIGLMFGLRLPINFAAPLAARNPADFFRRWHISLSRFMRDYVYFPLAGRSRRFARRGSALFFTVVLFGLWHGAALHFALWGAWIAVMIIIGQSLVTLWERMPVLVAWASTQILFLGSAPLWVDLPWAHATRVYKVMLGGGEITPVIAGLDLIVFCVVVYVAFATAGIWMRALGRYPKMESAILGAGAGLGFLGLGGVSQTFLYYQF
jgi:alginate O-acetyltransferase complex protein AlgI